MEQKFMCFVTAVILSLTIFICFLLCYTPNMHSIAVAIHDSFESYQGRQSVMDAIMAANTAEDEEAEEEIEDELRGHQIRLQLPKDVTEDDITIACDAVGHVNSITVDGIGKDYFNTPPIRCNLDHIVDMEYFSNDMVGIIDVTTDRVYEMSVTLQDNYAYFDFVDPHDIYDYVVVVDAGHGGSAPGATKQGVYEKDIDLDIVLELKNIFDKSDKNIGVYYTRTTDVNPSFNSRVGLANDSDADLFLSVHNNSTASGRQSSISGVEVMYHAADKTGESKNFANMCLDNLVEQLDARSRGLVVGDDIYIIRESQVPMALVEVGFMTNDDELEKLGERDYQKKAAQALYNSVIEYLYGE